MKDAESNPAGVVADADVLAADLLCDGAARESLVAVRSHSWMTLFASEQLLSDAQAVIASLTDETLAQDWRTQIESDCELIDHPPEDHPALATAYRSKAGHLLSFDDRLTSARANVSLKSHLALSVRPPDAFARLFDAASLYESLYDESYPGPDSNSS